MDTMLNTNAEKWAEESRDLPGFKNLSLPGIKEQVAQMLALIGREGIFSTYTIHDISHIDAMLRMLDWLVPKSTRAVMTPIDWLLTVLAVYLHDLGMLTTTQEYDHRLENSEFTAWRETLDKTVDGREYLARLNRMSPAEKDLFFFQEFIRRGHAQRIREWITGRHTRKWGPQVEPIARRVADLLKDVPTRFREYLGLACESHHRADLEKTDRYPLVARFGNDMKETANVQYAAILLRTTDLLHVTKDRTPSVMYETIKFSDPKSLDEWDKQLGTFAVGPKGRELIEDDFASAIIVINADFTEERPLFSLQEYIAYADSEIRQSKRWIEKSRETTDGKGYSFPWHKVDGDVWLEGVEPQPLRFELDRGQLLDLLVGHTIYNEPTVAIRELLQNGIDAVRYQAHIAGKEARASNQPSPSMGRVLVAWNPDNRLLTVEDDGIGMDRDVIKHHLMSVGSSYYNTPQFEAEHRDFVPISRFGIGILTCFMVSDDVEICTFRSGQGHRIRMTSVKSTYLLRELEPGDPLLDGLEPHGTRVKLRVRDTVDLSKQNVLDILRHWVILPECVVQYRETGQSPVTVGFSSVADALRSYQKPNDATIVPHSESPEVVVKARRTSPDADQDAGIYEIAFAVVSSFYPERSFVAHRYSDLPGVCIEGIRVSGQLPGFGSGGEGSLAGVLAVRGSRRFRTTVSREGLEIDDEYQHVATLCSEMLFEHVSDEATRISNKPGRPLSQAASAVQFLSGQLSRAASRLVKPNLSTLAAMQPAIVVERVDATPEKPVTSRILISPNELHEIPEFWTIESRSVDSLGLISLDLGRELSLNEFLIALAPDVTQLRYSPLIPHAQRSRNEILASHAPERVEFSRQHQQTAIKWTKQNPANECRIDLGKLMPRKRYQDYLSALRQNEALESAFDRLGVFEFLGFLEMQSAVISGDDQRVTAISSRMGTILQRESLLHQMWSRIRSTVIHFALQGPIENIVCGMTIANAFAARLNSNADQYGTIANSWRREISKFNSILNELGIKEELPSDSRELIDQNAVFNATAFWRDWDKHI